MKKLTWIFLTLILVLSLSVTAFASNDIKVKVGGELIDFDVQPQITGGRTGQITL